jgi:hypothetical protein
MLAFTPSQCDALPTRADLGRRDLPDPDVHHTDDMALFRSTRPSCSRPAAAPRASGWSSPPGSPPGVVGTTNALRVHVVGDADLSPGCPSALLGRAAGRQPRAVRARRYAVRAPCRGGGMADTEHSKCFAARACGFKSRSRHQDLAPIGRPMRSAMSTPVATAASGSSWRRTRRSSVLISSRCSAEAGYDVVGQASNGEQAVDHDARADSGPGHHGRQDARHGRLTAAERDRQAADLPGHHADRLQSDRARRAGPRRRRDGLRRQALHGCRCRPGDRHRPVALG